MSFREELKHLINKHSVENISNTPDFLLMVFLVNCLNAFNEATRARDKWYDAKLEPGQSTIAGNLALREWIEAEIAKKKEEQSSLTSHQLQVEDRGQLSIEIRALESVLEKLPKKNGDAGFVGSTTPEEVGKG